MKRLVSLLVALSMTALADAQELPVAVSDAYLRYEAALEQADFPAASLAAEAAYAEAQAAAIDPEIQLTLGLNALAMAPARGRGLGLVEIVESAAELARLAGEPELARDVYLQGLSAAHQAENTVAFLVLQDPLIEVLAAGPILSDRERERLFSSVYPNIFSEPLSDGLRMELELERSTALANLTDPVRLANLTLILRRDAMLREDHSAALELTDQAVQAIDRSTADGMRAVAALVAGLADILVTDGQGLPDALSSMAPETQSVLCADLASRPVPVGPWEEVRVPLRSVERGQLGGVARVEFSVQDGEFVELGPDPQTSPRRDSRLVRAIDRNLSRTEFHTDCEGVPVTMTGLFRVAFTGAVDGRRGAATQLSFRLLQSIRPVPIPPVENQD